MAPMLVFLVVVTRDWPVASAPAVPVEDRAEAEGELPAEEMALEEVEGQFGVPMPFLQIAHGER